MCYWNGPTRPILGTYLVLHIQLEILFVFLIHCICLSWSSPLSMEPQILEVNFSPDCTRLCRTHSGFFNDVFETLFLGKPTNSTRVRWSVKIFLKRWSIFWKAAVFMCCCYLLYGTWGFPNVDFGLDKFHVVILFIQLEVVLSFNSSLYTFAINTYYIFIAIISLWFASVAKQWWNDSFWTIFWNTVVLQ